MVAYLSRAQVTMVTNVRLGQNVGELRVVFLDVPHGGIGHVRRHSRGGCSFQGWRRALTPIWPRDFSPACIFADAICPATLGQLHGVRTTAGSAMANKC